MVQVNAKVERVSSKKLDEVFSHQKPFSDRSRLGHIGESSSAVNISKKVKYVKANEPTVVTTTTKKVKVEKNKNMNDQRVLIKSRNQSVVKPKAKGKSLSKRSKNKTFLPSL